MSAGGPLAKTAIGEMRDRVEWRSPVRTPGGTGQQKVSGSAVQATTWAKVVPRLGGERQTHDEQQPDHSHAITIRGGVTILHDWVAVWNGLTLQVVSAPPSGSSLANEQLILCREIPASTP